MLEITSTPLVIIGILGTVGILLPIISIARKEQGSNSFYAIIAFAALIVSMGYVGYQFISENVSASALFAEDVLVDDAFGGFFAIAMLIVALFTTVGSFNYMRKHNSPHCLLFSNFTCNNWYGSSCILNRPCNVICCMGTHEYSNIHFSWI